MMKPNYQPLNIDLTMETNYKLVIEHSLKQIEEAKIGNGFDNSFNNGRKDGLQNAIDIINFNVGYFGNLEILNKAGKSGAECGAALRDFVKSYQGLSTSLKHPTSKFESGGIINEKGQEIIDMKHTVPSFKPLRSFDEVSHFTPKMWSDLQKRLTVGNYREKVIHSTYNDATPKAAIQILQEQSKSMWGREWHKLGQQKSLETYKKAFNLVESQYSKRHHADERLIKSLQIKHESAIKSREETHCEMSKLRASYNERCDEIVLMQNKIDDLEFKKYQVDQVSIEISKSTNELAQINKNIESGLTSLKSENDYLTKSLADQTRHISIVCAIAAAALISIVYYIFTKLR